MSEFDLIRDYFEGIGAKRSDVLVGVGDDGALLEMPSSKNLVSVMDTLVESVHFPRTSPARSVGHRALAVNLSDVAAMGATPAWASLSLSVPQLDHDWLADFAAGFSECAEMHGVTLVGGDTVSGPLVVTVHVTGHVDKDVHVLRAGAGPGDQIYVTGTLGDAAAGLRAMTRGDGHSFLVERFLYPNPRVALGMRMGRFVSSAIDVSDGLGQDLGHLLNASNAGAVVALENLPLSTVLTSSFAPEEARYLALCGGDDYELCMTVPRHHVNEFEDLCESCFLRCQRIGQIDSSSGLRFTLEGKPHTVNIQGHDHFAADG
ncbi:MAG: thiamine-phosphate kinase [Gammaproteobacteria bacterium]